MSIYLTSIIDNVKTPLLLMLGGKDRRVPWDQSFDYYHILKSKGIECKILKYDEKELVSLYNF